MDKELTKEYKKNYAGIGEALDYATTVNNIENANNIVNAYTAGVDDGYSAGAYDGYNIGVQSDGYDDGAQNGGYNVDGVENNIVGQTEENNAW